MLRKSRKSCIGDIGVKRFQFNQSEQLGIYYYVSGVEVEKNQWKKMKDETRLRFVSYKEWKDYVWKKYEGYTLEKLEEFYRYLNIRKCNSKGNGDYIKLLNSNVLTFVLTYCFADGLIEIINKPILEGATLPLTLLEIVIKCISFLIIIVVFVWFILKMMPDYTKENIKEQFYDDYQEIIQEIIEAKK